MVGAARVPDRASMEPCQFRQGNCDFPSPRFFGFDASMEPCQFRQGNYNQRAMFIVQGLASMEPCQFRQGNETDAEEEAKAKAASMEPCQFRQGNSLLPMIFGGIRTILADFGPICPACSAPIHEFIPNNDDMGVLASENCESFLLGDFTTAPLAFRFDTRIDVNIDDSILPSNNGDIPGFRNQLTSQCL